MITVLWIAAVVLAVLVLAYVNASGLAFTAMFAALPGSLVAAPFSLILLGVITTQIGALQTVPVTIAVISAYLAVSGSGLLISLAQRQRKPAASDATGAASG